MTLRRIMAVFIVATLAAVPSLMPLRLCFVELLLLNCLQQKCQSQDDGQTL
jgi:hypothetical protein